MEKRDESIKQYLSEYENITRKYELELQEIKNNLKDKIAEFKVGDFVRNVTGIVKVEYTSLEFIHGDPFVSYHGFRYWNNGTGLKRTKDKNIDKLTFKITLYKEK